MKPKTLFLVALSLVAACTKEGAPMDSGIEDQRLTDRGSNDDTSAADIPIGPPVKLTLATFNVRNFFDENNDAGADTVRTEAEVAGKIKQLGGILQQLDADVLALQEVENRNLLNRLKDDQLADMDYDYVRLVEGNDVRGLDVALLSRFPVPRSISHARETFKSLDGTTNFGFSRDCLEVTIDVAAGRRLVVLINHLAAHDPDNAEESDERRYAQAKYVRSIVDGFLDSDPDVNLAVVGDLNDLPDAKTLQLLREGTLPLYDVAEQLPERERHTTYYKGDPQQIDYILVSPGLHADLTEGSVFIYRDDAVTETSDHFPVRAGFLLE